MTTLRFETLGKKIKKEMRKKKFGSLILNKPLKKFFLQHVLKD